MSLDAARHLALAGVPIFLAPYSDNRLGFRLPEEWEKTPVDPTVVDRWKPGMALCAVMGHVVDAIDVDPRNGGSIEALVAALGGVMPRVYGVQSTPSGGHHYLIAATGARKAQSLVTGVDIQAGNADGVGRGFLFLAPTVRESKLDGEARIYEWETRPNLDALVLGDDDSGAGLIELLSAHHGRVRSRVDADGTYTGPLYAELDADLQSEADGMVAAQIEGWTRRLDAAANWPEGYRDDRGRGWEALAYQSAWALAKMAACPWMGLSEEEAERQYRISLPAELEDDASCAGKWYGGIVNKASGEPVDEPPWVVRGDVRDDFGYTREECDATNAALAAVWLDDEMGQRRLSCMFRRQDDLIYTPRVNEDGYVPPNNAYDYDGPAQVRRMSALQLSKRVDIGYRVLHTHKNGTKRPVLFPRDVAERSMSMMDNLRHLKDLRMVTHTPMVRADGSVLELPGFDVSSGVLYLPERGLQVPAVPAAPTEDDVASSRKLLMSVVQDFPFESEHCRANYLGCLFIPLIRSLVPPPYKMLIIGAPQRGSGKSLLALIMRTIHGGVFRAEIPREEDERRKVITSILDSTSAPVVQFDNVSGTLRSSTMDGLLTSAVWSDRRLGVNVNLDLPNDRLWVITGNNVQIGGDLDRRVLWSTINANMEHPETRLSADFGIPNIEGWVAAHRGEILHAMLVLVRNWAAAGMPTGEAPSSDSFGRITQVLQGILDHADISGVVGHVDSRPPMPDLETEDWGQFLRAARREMGDKWWTSKDLLARVSDFEDGMSADELPADLGDKLRHGNAQVVKALGRMMSFRKDQRCGGLRIEGQGGGNRSMTWRVSG